MNKEKIFLTFIIILLLLSVSVAYAEEPKWIPSGYKKENWIQQKNSKIFECKSSTTPKISLLNPDTRTLVNIIPINDGINNIIIEKYNEEGLTVVKKEFKITNYKITSDKFDNLIDLPIINKEQIWDPEKNIIRIKASETKLDANLDENGEMGGGTIENPIGNIEYVLNKNNEIIGTRMNGKINSFAKGFTYFGDTGTNYLAKPYITLDIGDSAYYVSSNGKIYSLNNGNLIRIREPEATKIMGKITDVFEKNNNKFELTKATKNKFKVLKENSDNKKAIKAQTVHNYGAFLIQKLDAAWIGALYSYVDKTMGDYSFGIPEGICKNWYYHDSNVKKISIKSNEQSEQFVSQITSMFEDITSTISISGEKYEMYGPLYRYNYEINLIAKNDGTEWETQLSNSCTGLNLTVPNGHGTFDRLKYVNRYYPLTYGENSCPFEKDENGNTPECVFDQSCVIYGDGQTFCKTLAGNFESWKTEINGKLKCTNKEMEHKT